jgi:hypothetical protein
LAQRIGIRGGKLASQNSKHGAATRSKSP